MQSHKFNSLLGQDYYIFPPPLHFYFPPGFFFPNAFYDFTVELRSKDIIRELPVKSNSEWTLKHYFNTSF